MLLLRSRRCETFKLRNVHITISVLRNVYYEVFVTKYVSYDFGGILPSSVQQGKSNADLSISEVTKGPG